MSCSVELLRQRSSAPCRLNESFGCHANGKQIWLRRGCRGVFRCGADEAFRCPTRARSRPSAASHHCHCDRRSPPVRTSTWGIGATDVGSHSSSAAWVRDKHLKTVFIDPVSNRSCGATILAQWSSHPSLQTPAKGVLSDLVPLLSIVAADSSAATQIRVLGNMASFAAVPWMLADWAIVLVDAGEAEWEEAKHLSRGIRSRLGVCNGLPPDDGAFHPKLYLQANLLDVLLRRAYAAVFLLDADIAWPRLSALDFFARWRCDFGERPPLVAQGLVRGVRVRWWPMSYDAWAAAWARNATLRSVRGVRVGFLEQQALLVDARFLLWFMHNGGLELTRMQEAWHNDYGLNSILCGAADAHRARFAHGRSASCVLITVPYEHISTQMIAQKGRGRGRAHFWTKFQMGASAVIHFARTRFAQWFAFRSRRLWSGDEWREQVWAQLHANAVLDLSQAGNSVANASEPSSAKPPRGTQLADAACWANEGVHELRGAAWFEYGLIDGAPNEHDDT